MQPAHTWPAAGLSALHFLCQHPTSLLPLCCAAAVTKNNDFIRAAQAEPYGDITITRGPFL